MTETANTPAAEPPAVDWTEEGKRIAIAALGEHTGDDYSIAALHGFCAGYVDAAIKAAFPGVAAPIPKHLASKGVAAAVAMYRENHAADVEKQERNKALHTSLLTGRPEDATIEMIDQEYQRTKRLADVGEHVDLYPLIRFVMRAVAYGNPRARELALVMLDV